MVTPRRLAWAGLGYSLFYAFATALLPRPESASLRIVLADLFLFVPTALAFGLTLRAARASQGAERAFWGLFAAAAFAQMANQMLWGLYQVVLPEARLLRALSLFGYYSAFVLIVAALLVRPERSRAGRVAALEWLMAVVGGYFVVFYFALLPIGSAEYPWFLVYTLQETLPAALAAWLALRTPEEPFRSVYRLLAAGFGGAALLGVAPNWLYARGGYEVYGPLDVDWALPFLGLAAAAACPRGAVWVNVADTLQADRRRARLAAVAVAVPPILDLGMRALGAQPELADTRAAVALLTAALLSTLVALRFRWGVETAPLPAEPVREASREPSEFLQLASGAAHELNNPLMAVAGWAELAQRRAAARAPGGEGAEGLQDLVAAVRRAADAVSRLQKVARSGRATAGEP